MRQISESLNGNNDAILSNPRAAISELYNEDNDANDFSANGQINTKIIKGNLANLNRDEDMSQPLIESNSEIETTVKVIHGTNQLNEVKIIDKTKRAYDISIDATRSLETALHKDKKRCSHICERTKSVFYSLYILALKFHGSPPV